MRKIVAIALLLSLPATAQDWFEYRAETHSCWLPKPKVEWKRWERDGDVYRCPNSPVVVSRAQVQTYLQGLSRAHNEPECGPDAVQRAKDRVASDFGIRDDVLDLESRISPDSILQSYQNSFPSLSTGWTERKLTLEGQPFRVKSLLDLEENPRTYICRDDDTSDCVCSFATLDFLRILSDAEPGAEIDYYVGQNDFNKGKDYWASLAQLQEQPNFQEWQSTFSLQRAFECNLQTLASGKGDWRIWLAPRENRGISRISWHISSYKPGVCGYRF